MYIVVNSEVVGLAPVYQRASRFLFGKEAFLRELPVPPGLG
jgi:hypothetical protein